jgi:hypothetical protein
MDDIDKLVDINYLSQSNISLSKALLVFYVIIGSQFTGNLLGKQLRTFVEENRIAQHVIGFILMAVLINIIGQVNEVDKIFLYSVVGYIWFVLTTKLDIQWNIIIIMLLLVGFVYDNIVAQKERDAQKDSVLTAEEKTNIMVRHHSIRTYMVISIFVVTLIGTALYINKKGLQYGNGFDTTTFFLY